MIKDTIQTDIIRIISNHGRAFDDDDDDGEVQVSSETNEGLFVCLFVCLLVLSIPNIQYCHNIGRNKQTNKQTTRHDDNPYVRTILGSPRCDQDIGTCLNNNVVVVITTREPNDSQKKEP